MLYFTTQAYSYHRLKSGPRVSMEVPLISKDRYRTIMQLAPDVVYTLAKDGAITSLSSAFERITGWKIEEWVGKNFAGIIHPEDLPRAIKNFKKSLSGKEVPSYRLRVLRKNGTYLYGEFKSAPDTIEGKLIGVIGIGRDITHQYKKEEDLIHYKNLVESSDSAVISRDLKGKVLTWNKAAEKLFGHREDEIVGKNFSILVPSGHKNEIQRIDRMVKQLKHVEDYEAVRVRKDGKKIYISAKISPIIDEKGKIAGVSLFNRDNYAKKREQMIERFLARATKVLSSSLDYNYTLKKLSKILIPDLADWSTINIFDDHGKLAQVAVAHKDPKKVKWAIDLQSKIAALTPKQEEQERIERTLSGNSQFYPVITSEILDKMVKNRKLRKLIDLLELKSVITVPIISGKKVLGSMSLISIDNNRIYDEKDLGFFEELGRRAGHAVDNAKLYREAQFEIRERKKIQDQLASSEERLKIILANVADGITVYDTVGKLSYVNEAAARASGYSSPAKMLANPLKWRDTFELTHEDGRPYLIEELPGRRAVVEKKEMVSVINYKNKKTGEDKWSVVKARPVLDEKGNVKTVVNIINDITQRKELERKKDDFISIASHELRTPITSIKGFVHILKKRLENEDNLAVSYLGRVDHQLGKLAELVEDLLEMSRLRMGSVVYNKSTFSFSTLVKEVVSDMQQTDEQHKIVLHNGVRKKINGDRDRISQVLINLINNAMKYSSAGKKVIVTLKEHGNYVQAGVRDYGIGIDAREKNKIFDRFYRVEDVKLKTFPGLGIGLYLSREIIARHNGKIWFDSKKGKGSTFYFEIPASPSESGRAAS